MRGRGEDGVNEDELSDHPECLFYCVLVFIVDEFVCHYCLMRCSGVGTSSTKAVGYTSFPPKGIPHPFSHDHTPLRGMGTTGLNVECLKRPPDVGVSLKQRSPRGRSACAIVTQLSLSLSLSLSFFTLQSLHLSLSLSRVLFLCEPCESAVSDAGIAGV
jgi:hypothetical protein